MSTENPTTTHRSAAATTAFEWLCTALYEHTPLGGAPTASATARQMAVRGTVRLALQRVGLDSDASPDEIRVVLERVLPQELSVRGVKNAAELCGGLVDELGSMTFAQPSAGDDFKDFLKRLL